MQPAPSLDVSTHSHHHPINVILCFPSFTRCMWSLFARVLFLLTPWQLQHLFPRTKYVHCRANGHHTRFVRDCPSPHLGKRQHSNYAVILELRLYAMYGRSKRILILLFVLISCESTAMGVLFGVVKAGVIGEWTSGMIHVTATDAIVQAQITLPRECWSAQTPTQWMARTGSCTTGSRFSL